MKPPTPNADVPLLAKDWLLQAEGGSRSQPGGPPPPPPGASGALSHSHLLGLGEDRFNPLLPTPCITLVTSLSCSNSGRTGRQPCPSLCYGQRPSLGSYLAGSPSCLGKPGSLFLGSLPILISSAKLVQCCSRHCFFRWIWQAYQVPARSHAVVSLVPLSPCASLAAFLQAHKTESIQGACLHHACSHGLNIPEPQEKTCMLRLVPQGEPCLCWHHPSCTGCRAIIGAS